MLRPSIWWTGPLPHKLDYLDLIDTLENVLSDMMLRWFDGIPAEVRAELMVRAYEPVLHMLIRARRRPEPRFPPRRDETPAQ